jgi:glycosyltransferase involved in cell wall biosynthesis
MKFKVNKKQTICVCMIVKNESHVIGRCIRSFAPLADYFIICDTGSTDNTIETIKKTADELDLKGEVLEHTWRNFAHNRTLSLKAGKNKADYLLVIDADEVIKYRVGTKYFEVDDIKVDPKLSLSNLDKDCYNILSELGSITYDRLQLMSTKLDWRYESVVHEFAIADNIRSIDRLTEFMNMPRVEGSRSKDPNKYIKDALELEKGLLDEPHNSRYYFYLAQCYRDASMFKESKINYLKRLEMTGYDEELNVCYHQLAHCSKMLGEKLESYSHFYIDGYNKFPHRLECIYEYVIELRTSGKAFIAYNIGYQGIHVPFPENDHLFILKDIYTHLYKIEIALCCIDLKKYEEAIIIFKYILDFHSNDLGELKRNEITNLIFKLCSFLGKQIERLDQVKIEYNIKDFKYSKVNIENCNNTIVLVGNNKQLVEYQKELQKIKNIQLEKTNTLNNNSEEKLYLVLGNENKNKWNEFYFSNETKLKQLYPFFDLNKNQIKKYVEIFGSDTNYIKKYKNIMSGTPDVLLLGRPNIQLLERIVSCINIELSRIVLITGDKLDSEIHSKYTNILKPCRHLIIGNLESSPFVTDSNSLFNAVGIKDIKVGWVELNDTKLKPFLNTVKNI